MEKWSHQSLPHSITEDIIKYLEEAGHTDVEEGALTGVGLRTVQSILAEILEKIANRSEYIEEYYAKLKAHNQYPLFDLSTVIENFCIDDELYEKLTFRETLVISTFTTSKNPLVPDIVGGLCLDVQTALGKNPLFRKQTGLHQKLIELITVLQKQSRSSLGTLNVESQDELEKFTATLLPHYERNYSKFIVHVSSQFDVNGFRGGSRITSWVDRKLHTIEEKRKE